MRELLGDLMAHVGRWPKIVGIAIALGFLAVWFGWNHGSSVQAETGGTNSNAQPANKIAIAGGSIDILGAQAGNNGDTNSVHEILRGSIKTSSPTDLIFSLNLECALWTTVTALNDQGSQASATVKAWVELDGGVVKVSGDDATDPGKVVFCNRVYRMDITKLDDKDAEFKQFLGTRSANGFEWITLNVGSGVHSIVVKAELDSSVDGQGAAKAGVGKRTLVVEPVKLANNASI